MLSAETRKAMNLALREVVDAASAIMYRSDAPRTHLGASVIGEDCAAKIWYSFRWAKTGEYSGQQLRLFNTGHIYEDRFIAWFRAAGFEVFPFSEDGNQWRITDCEGHFGGSMDSGAIFRGVNIEALSEIVGETKAINLANVLQPLRNEVVIMEFKTHNDKNFKNLQKHGVRLAFPTHFKQFSTYGKFYKVPYSIYAGYNKNNDEFWPEVIVNDYSLADDMVRKAEEIIVAETRPQRESENETYYKCNFCTFKGICHQGKPMEQNCRSCRFAKAGPAKSWICTYWNGKTIPPDFIPQGCGQWAQIG